MVFTSSTSLWAGSSLHNSMFGRWCLLVSRVWATCTTVQSCTENSITNLVRGIFFPDRILQCPDGGLHRGDLVNCLLQVGLKFPCSLLGLCHAVSEGLLHPVGLLPQVLAGVGQRAAYHPAQPDTRLDSEHSVLRTEWCTVLQTSRSCSASLMLLSVKVCQSPGRLSVTLYNAFPDLRWMFPRVFFKFTLLESYKNIFSCAATLHIGLVFLCPQNVQTNP